MSRSPGQIILLILTFLLAIVFLFAGVSKLISYEAHSQSFSQWGFPIWTMYLIGLLEIVGAIGLLIPKFRVPAAMVLSMLMFGALGVHIYHSEFNQMLIPALLALCANIVARRSIFQVLNAQ